MLVYLSDINRIINTDEISDVSDRWDYRTDDDFAKSLLNVEIESKLPLEEQSHECCTITLKNNSKIFLNIGVEDFWNLIQSNL